MRLLAEDQELKAREIFDLNQKLENQTRSVKLQQALIDKLKKDVEDERTRTQEIEHQCEHLQAQGISEEKKAIIDSLQKQLKQKQQNKTDLELLLEDK